MTSAMETPQLKPTSLYVGDLHPLVSDALLFTKFSEVGAIINARVCRDMISRESLGYGYVNFRDHKDAEQALDLMNYGVFFGRPFRLMWSQKDPTLRKSGKGNIFVKNLDKTILPTELYDTFEQFGKILSCKLATDEKGQSKGFGFVHFESEESALRAVNYVNGKEIRGRVLFVGPFIPKADRKASSSAAKFNNCYVKNFGPDMDDEQFRKMFEKYGEIKSACVMRDDKGQSKGFGFVCFEDPSSAEGAVKDMDGMDINGKPIYVGRAQRKDERQEELKAKYEKQRTERQSRYAIGVNLYVKNLDDTIDDEKLHEAFSKFGDITSAKVMRDQNGVSRSFGFVCFRNPEHATVAVTNMNTVMLGNKPLYVAIAQRKEDRRAKLAAEFQARVDQLKAQMYSLPALPTAGYQLSQPFYRNQFVGQGPRWQQPMVGNAPLQAYQSGAAARAGGQQALNNMLQFRNQATGPAQLANRNAALGANAMGQMPNFVRQNPQRQIGGMNPAGMQPRINLMPQGVTQLIQQQQQQQQQRGPSVPQQNRGDSMGGVQQQRYGTAQSQQQQRSTIMSNQQQVMQQQQPVPVPKESDEEVQRQVLGTRLYQFIETIYPQYVGKLTGVILTLGLPEVSALFDDPRELESKVHEVFNQWQAKNADADKKEKAGAK